MNDMSTGFGTLAPFSRLMTAHAALIRETSETMSAGISDGLDALGAAMDALDCPTGRAEIERIKAQLLTSLQAEDFLRQQVLVLEHGLAILGEGVVPPGVPPEQWLEDRLDEIKARYVMQRQHALHAVTLNRAEEAAPAPGEDEIELF